MINEAIILAGGYGKRLTNVQGVPKPMAPINGVPFLQILLDNLIVKGISIFHLSVGHQHEVIVNYFGNSYMGCKINYIIEDSPLGTGGAIQKSLLSVTKKNVWVINGDTYFDIDLQSMYEHHLANEAEVTIALKLMQGFDRYGRVIQNSEFRIEDFLEKQPCDSGLINGGVYLINSNLFKGLNLPQQFSMEEDYFNIFCAEKNFYGFTEEGYFIDIGIPEDYDRAHQEL